MKKVIKYGTTVEIDIFWLGVNYEKLAFYMILFFLLQVPFNANMCLY